MGTNTLKPVDIAISNLVLCSYLVFNVICFFNMVPISQAYIQSLLWMHEHHSRTISHMKMNLNPQIQIPITKNK